jgi:hypothetical protein
LKLAVEPASPMAGCDGIGSDKFPYIVAQVIGRFNHSQTQPHSSLICGKAKSASVTARDRIS